MVVGPDVGEIMEGKLSLHIVLPNKFGNRNIENPLPPTDFLQGAQEYPHPQKKTVAFRDSWSLTHSLTKQQKANAHAKKLLVSAQ